MPDFTKAAGAKAAEKEAKSTVIRGRPGYLSIKKSSVVFARFLNDTANDPANCWLTLPTHVAVPTKDAPKDYNGKWPSHMSAVCPNATVFRLPGTGSEPGPYEEGFGDCYIHANYRDVKGQFGSYAETVGQTYSLVVLREVAEEAGKISGIHDKMEEYKDPEGNIHSVPAIRMITQRWSNFFGQLNSTAYISGTVLNTDYMIKRDDGNNYNIVPLPEIPDVKPGTPHWAKYEAAAELLGYNLPEIITGLASKDYIGRWFDPSWKPPKDESKDSPAAESVPDEGPQASGDGDLSEAQVEDFRKALQANAVTPTASG